MISIQKFSTLGIRKDKDSRRCTRGYIDTGKFCNYDCEFCYYKNQLDNRDSLEIVKKRIKYAKDYGLDSVDFCGGESSVEPNWFNFLDYAVECGFKSINTITNGSKFCDMEFLKKSVKHGLTEILFSLHGFNEESHDLITKRKGSFKKIIKAIENANELGLTVRINCTVSDTNHKGLTKDYPILMKRLKPLEINFIAVRYESDNSGYKKVEYKEIIDSIKLSIDLIKEDIKYINMRFVPFCFAKNYEKHVVNHYQHIYDIFDWNRGTYQQEVPIKNYTYNELLEHDYFEAEKTRINGYHKDITCKECKYFYICDGIDKHLAGQELIPVQGEKINDVNIFRKDFYDINDSYINA